MGKNSNGKLATTTHATAEISLSFDATRFDETRVRDAIQKQLDKNKNVVCFIGGVKKNSFTRRTVTVSSDWIVDSSPLSFGKWSSATNTIAKAITNSIAGIKGIRLIECKLTIIDRRDNAKSVFKIF